MKKYDDINEIFADGIFLPSDILIIWGKRGKGKSSFAGKLMSEFMKPKNAKHDVIRCKHLCEKLKEAGYYFHPPTDHLVFSDTFFEKQVFTKKTATHFFSPIDFALPNDTHPTGLICPYGKYFIDEAQDVYDSHISALPTFVTKNFELSRQSEIFTGLIAQRPMRIHKDIRELATFVEVVGLENKYNKYGRLVETIWTCNIIYDNANLEEYLRTKKRKYIDKKVKFVYYGNIFRCYDSHYFLPMYFKGMQNRDFDLEYSHRTEFSPASFEDFNSRRMIDIPDTFRGKKKK